MDKYNEIFDEDPGLEGPDYVALVIDWDVTADGIEDEIADTTQRLHRSPRWTKVAAIASVAGVLALAGWGVKRLLI